VLNVTLRHACLETAWRRPRATGDKFTLALMPKHFYEFAHATSRQLEGLVRDLRNSDARAPRTSSPVSATG
jgi:hypothetical protein